MVIITRVCSFCEELLALLISGVGLNYEFGLWYNGENKWSVYEKKSGWNL